MAIKLCVSGFGEEWDGTYEEVSYSQYAQLPDHKYWIYRSTFYWFISISEYLYKGEGRRLAEKYTDSPIMDPTGSYEGVFGYPSGIVSYGRCE